MFIGTDLVSLKTPVVVLLFGLVCGFTFQSTAMVVSRRSVDLTKLFLGKLD